MTRTQRWLSALALASITCTGCGDDDVSEADRLGVGAECSSDDDCVQSSIDAGFSQRCLRQFKGGYCGIEGCESQLDCPDRAACVAHDDGNRYCFRLCANTPECNLNRSLDNEANCASSIEYVGDDADLGKACVPPSSGD
jgi:hypothetical protein